MNLEKVNLGSINNTLPEHSPDIPLSIHDLTVAYQRKPVVWDIDLDIPKGKLVAIIGPNGAGKSTLIKACLDLVPKVSGQISFYGKPYSKRRELVGYVPQRQSVDWDFPINVLDVVTMGLYGKIGWIRPVRRKHVELAMESLEKVGMADLAKRQINQLSGGQQQRVFIARALAQDSDLYFMDEPFLGVDVATEQALVKCLKELQRLGKTTVAVHHDLGTVTDYFDWVILLNMRVVASGSIEKVFTPENLKKTYGGKLSLLVEASHALTRFGA